LKFGRKHLHSRVDQLGFQQILLLFRFLYPFQIMVGVHYKDHGEIDQEVEVHHQDQSVNAFLDAVLFNAEGAHKNSLKVKYEPDDQSDHNGKYRVHNKNAHPGIPFVQKAFCANGNKGHVADDDDPVNKDIIDKDICPALLYLLHNEIPDVSDLRQVNDVKKCIKGCKKKDQLQVDVFLNEMGK